MLEPQKPFAGRFSLSDWIILAVALIIALFVIALGFDFDPNDTLEVLLTGLALIGVMGTAAAIAWAVGRLVDSLSEER